jgi:thiol-disulfide isomerase/thioredoxin
LDLARGAVPLRLYQQQATPDVPVNAFDRWQPSEVTTTHAVRELPGGGCYPAKTVMECWQQDADAPPLTLQELAEIREGKRRLPMSVHRRYTWDCSLVEVSQPKQADFFVLPFSEEQKLYDHDAGKVVGALEEKPLVEVGQPAPPWSIGRWLDGRTRTLEDLKGQVVVLNFWGLTCGGCRDSVSQWKAIQDRFADRPVAFIGIHTAEADSTALAARITEFQRSHKWLAIGAIDAGRMTENSVTTNAYGIKQFPCTVIVDPAGKVAYVDPYLDGPACDEDDEASIAEFEQKFNAIMAERFQAVGETWPMSNGLDEKAQQAIGRKVEALYLTRQI